MKMLKKEADLMGKRQLVLYRGTCKEQAAEIQKDIFPIVSWWTDNLEEAKTYIDDDGVILTMEIELNIELINFFKYATVEVSPYTGFGVRLNTIDNTFNFSFSKSFLENNKTKKISM